MTKLSPRTRLQPGVLVEPIERKICIIRGHKVMIDTDLAELYAVPTKKLNQQVRRNLRRFPKDFMFQLTSKEAFAMRSQIVTTSRRNLRHRPLVFTEQGIAMLSSVLTSERAVQINIAIMRAFLHLREVVIRNRSLARRIRVLEKKGDDHDSKFEAVFETFEQLMNPSSTRRSRRIGFGNE